MSFEDLMLPPGRSQRPPKLVVIMRGLPGSGKTHVARTIKTTETEQGFEPPRILALDDYFECDGEVILKITRFPSYWMPFVKQWVRIPLPSVDFSFLFLAYLSSVSLKEVQVY